MTQTPSRSTVVGVFQERDDARRAIEALKDDGFSPDAISILSPDKQTTQTMAEETGTHAGSGAATGAVTGGILGGLGRIRTRPASDACARASISHSGQVSSRSPAIWNRLPGCSISLAEVAGAVQVAHRADAHRPLPGDDVLGRVLAEGPVSRANEQAADLAAVINLACAVVWLLLLR